MSISIITTYENITINETLYDESIYDYVKTIIDTFEDKDKIHIMMNIKTDKELITIKIK